MVLCLRLFGRMMKDVAGFSLLLRTYRERLDKQIQPSHIVRSKIPQAVNGEFPQNWSIDKRSMRITDDAQRPPSLNQSHESMILRSTKYFVQNTQGRSCQYLPPIAHRVHSPSAILPRQLPVVHPEKHPSGHTQCMHPLLR